MHSFIHSFIYPRTKASYTKLASSVYQSFFSVDHEYDALVIGAGGAGLRAAMGCAEAGWFCLIMI